MTFDIFRKRIGATTEELVKSTGYSRQGLYKAVKNVRTEGFKAIIYNVIQKKIAEENIRHDNRIEELKQLEKEFMPFSVMSAELDKVHYL